MAGNKMNYGCKNIGCNSELVGKGLTEIWRQTMHAQESAHNTQGEKRGGGEMGEICI